jgi:uroporphyrinogen-III synthase
MFASPNTTVARTKDSTKPIAVPESRELETLSLLLKNRGLPVVEVPLVAILDAPEPALSYAWLQRFVNAPPALLVLLTGEGLRRLLLRADEIGLRSEFVTALGAVPTLCRGSKPEKVLRELDIQPQYSAAAPTSDGVLITAQELSLKDKRVALQLYGQEPNLLLQNGLRALGAQLDCVAPYIYASREDELKVAAFIRRLAAGEIGMVAFTSQAQYKRLLEVAKSHGLQQALQTGLQSAVLAAVGPIVKAQLEAEGLQVAIMPERVYFMKPLVAAIVRYLQDQQ